MQVLTLLGPLKELLTSSANSAPVAIASDHIFGTSEYELNGRSSTTGKIALEDLAELRIHPWKKMTNLSLDGDVDQAETELLSFAAKGGVLIVETTPLGRGRQADRLVALSNRMKDKLHIVAGTGWSVQDETEYTVDELYKLFRSEITKGLGTSIDSDDFNKPRAFPTSCAGLIGEICLTPSILSDSKSSSAVALNAAIKAHVVTGCPVLVNVEAGGSLHALDMATTVVKQISSTKGADITKLAISGIQLVESMSAINEVDHEKSLNKIYNFVKNSNCMLALSVSQDIQLSGQDLLMVLKAVRYMVENGLQSKVILAQKTKYKTHLCRYGGHGYSYISDMLAPALDLNATEMAQVCHENLINFLSFWVAPQAPPPKPETFWNCDYCNKAKPASFEPFTYLEYRYCSMKCLKEHKQELNAKKKNPDDKGNGGRGRKNVSTTKWGIAVGSG